jgi:hypothetical protein
MAKRPIKIRKEDQLRHERRPQGMSCAKQVEAMPGISGRAVDLRHNVESLGRRDLRRRSRVATPGGTTRLELAGRSLRRCFAIGLEAPQVKGV